MGCGSLSCTRSTDNTTGPTPGTQPSSLPLHRPNRRRCSLLCIAGVEVPSEHSTSVRKISVQSNGRDPIPRNPYKGSPPTKARGQIFEVCDAQGKPLGKGHGRPILSKIPELEENPKLPYKVPKFMPILKLQVDLSRSQEEVNVTEKEQRALEGEEESLRGSLVPRLPPLVVQTRRPTESDDLRDNIGASQKTLDSLLKKSHRTSKKRRSHREKMKQTLGRMESRTPRDQKVKVLWQASYDSIGRLSNICDVAFLRPDCVALSQDAPAKIGLQLYDVAKAGMPGAAIGEPEICSPRGICVDREGHVVVTDAHSKTVKFMDTYGNYLASWKHGKFRLPAGIAQTKDGHFVVSDEGGGAKAIGLYSGRGTVIRKFGMPWFDCPWYVQVDNYNRVLVSEQSISGVIVFDNHGRFLFKFGSFGGGEGQLNFQSGIAVDSKNHILVADSDNYRVCLFSPDGYFIENVISHLPSRPVSLALHEPQSLLVVVTESDIYMHHINNYGSVGGMF